MEENLSPQIFTLEEKKSSKKVMQMYTFKSKWTETKCKDKIERSNKEKKLIK